MTSLRSRLIEALDGYTVVIDRRPKDQRGGPFGGGWHGPLDNAEEVADHILSALPSLAEAERGRREANDGPGPDGHHVVTGECFACMVGVATGPESHGDRCPRSADRLREAMDGPQ